MNYTVNLAPKESEKTQAWIEETVRAIGQRALIDIRDRKKDMICHMYYNGINNEAEFEYLNSVGDYVYPAKIRFFPIIRPKVDLQISKLTRRALSFRAFASDELSLRERYEKKMQSYLMAMDVKIKTQRALAKERIMELEIRLQQINQQLQIQPKDQEEAMMLQQLKAMKPLIIQAITQAKTIDSDFLLITAEEEENIERNFKMKYEDIIEKGAQSFLKKSIRENCILEESIQAFKNGVITGKPIYFVDTLEGERFPDFRALSGLSVCWSAEESSRYIQDCPWASYTVKMSIGSVISQFPEMSNNDRERLNSFASVASSSNMYTNFDHHAVFGNDSQYTTYSGSSLEKLVDVTFVYFRSPRKAIRKFSPNKYMPGKYYSHVISEDDLENKPLKEGEKLQIRYIDDIYQGVLIGNVQGLVVDAKLKDYQVYDVDTLKTELPIVGYTFNSVVDEPYSYIWSTKDFQDLYNILRYQEELLIVLSGVKGFVMDKAQKPDDMEYDEWMYNRKMGVAWIDTMKKKFGRNPTFNQFSSYDDSLSQSVIYIEEILQRIDEAAGMIIGIPRQAIGQTVSTDQVGSNKMSIEQSTLINELMFYKHFELLGRALTRYMNCARDQGLNQEILSHVNEDLSVDSVMIPKGLFDGRKVDIYVSNTTKEFEGIEQLKQLAVNERAAGTIDLGSMVKIFNAETLRDIETTMEYAVNLAQKRAMDMQQSNEEFRANHENELKQLEAQQEQMKQQLQFKIEELKNQIKERELQAEMAQKAVENQLKEKELSLKANAAAQQNAANAYDKQTKAMNDRFSNQIQALKNQVDALLGSRGLDIKEKEVALKARQNNNRSN